MEHPKQKSILYLGHASLKLRIQFLDTFETFFQTPIPQKNKRQNGILLFAESYYFGIAMGNHRTVLLPSRTDI